MQPGNSISSPHTVSSVPYIPGGLVSLGPEPVNNRVESRGHVRKYADGSDNEAEADTHKRSRMANEGFYEGDAEVESNPQRGHKRSTENDEIADRQDKRARKVSLEQPDADMLVDETEDELAEMGFVPTRGKSKAAGMKRRQSEAGSTFGGDDSFELALDEEEDNGHSHHRKRRTLQKQAHVSRGRKRDREDSESDEDVEMKSNDSLEQSTSRKRGKRSTTAASERSFLLDQDVSNDPLCKGRKIGEEWEVNGLKYKVGMNGQRLRHALVKKKQPTKFPMVSSLAPYHCGCIKLSTAE
jgi:hypothetical protein